MWPARPTALGLFATAMLALGADATAGTRLDPVPVFSYNDGGFPCTRIPSLLALPGGKTLLAFVECRMFTGDGCEPTRPLNGTGAFGQDRYMCMKASADGGRSWGALRKNLTAGRAANPSALYDAATGDVVVQYDNPVDYGTGLGWSGGIWQVVSKDGGLTWGAPRNLTAEGGVPVGQYHLGSAGAGAQITAGPHAGRLVFTGYTHLPKPNNTLHARVWYSDDHGATWELSPQVLPHMGEPQMSELLAPRAGGGTGGGTGGGQPANSSSSRLAIVARNNNHVVRSRKRAVKCFEWVFFLISSGSPHVRPMGRTCREPDEIELTAMG